MFVEALEDRRLYAATAKFVTQMLGASEVPARTTPARGTARFTMSRDGTELRYQLKANRIVNVVGAHIHLAPAGENGAIVADLMDPAGMRERRRGVTMRGSIVASELAGPLAGMTLADLVTRMTEGATYVNVHTNDGAEPADTGPGDFPGGEIRGQVRRIGRFNTTNPILNPTPDPTPGY